MTLTLGLESTPVSLIADAPQQVCYILVTIATQMRQRRPVNWALVADASRSMRIPIISDAQFRALVRAGGAQEIMIDGVPVWQLTGQVPAEIRDHTASAIDHVARALHSVVEQLDAADRFALIACAETAALVVPSTPGDGRAALVGGIGKLKTLQLGDETVLAYGLQMALQELAAGRQTTRADHILLLTDGFTHQSDACRTLAREAAATGVAISTLGLGGEFQEDLLTELADTGGGRAVFLRHAEDIPAAVTRELQLARAAATVAASLTIRCADGVTIRHATRLLPVLASLQPVKSSNRPREHILLLGEIAAATPTQLLLELLISSPLTAASATSTNSANIVQLAQFELTNGSTLTPSVALTGRIEEHPSALPPAIIIAAGRATIARLQRRVQAALASGQRDQAIQLLHTIANRLDDLGEHAIATTARSEATSLERTGQTSRLGAKELTYATRQIGTQS